MQPETPPKPKGLPGAQVVKVRNSSHQDGAVVSREIVKKPTGNVTLFAVDVGQGLSEHTTPFDALAQVLEGDVEITISGQAHRLRGGCHARRSPALKALTRFKMILTIF